jgi:CheY-like chemotaxis protein
MIAEILQIEGCPVAMASHGREALDFLQRHPGRYLITLGLVMPVLDGWGFLDELAAMPEERGKHRIIIISGSARRFKDYPVSDEVHVDAVLAQPFRVTQLLNAVETARQRWSQA